MGRSFPSVEHAYQAAKFTCFGYQEKIRNASTAGEAKRLGQVKTGLRSDWELVKYHIMEIALRKKFNIEELKQALLDTDHSQLIEGNTWHDNIWGSCSCVKCLGEDKQNRLGEILMYIRNELRS